MVIFGHFWVASLIGRVLIKLVVRFFVTNEHVKEWKTLDERSVQLIPANGKPSDNKRQTSSATVISWSDKLREHLLATEKLANDTCRYGFRHLP